jgi:hypothetical protein
VPEPITLPCTTNKIWAENLKGRDLLGDVGVNLRIILKCTAKKWGLTLWGEFNWLRLGHIIDTCELGKDPWDVIEGGESVDLLTDSPAFLCTRSW